jgi:hypothetical protein
LITAPFMTGPVPGRNGMVIFIRIAFFIRQMAPSGNRNLPPGVAFQKYAEQVGHGCREPKPGRLRFPK